MTVRKIGAAFLAVTLGATVVVGCREPSPASGNRVLLVGDSIFAGSRANLEGALRTAGWVPIVQAQAGTTIEDWSKVIDRAVAFAQPDVVVLELGTNDCGTVACVNLTPYIDTLMEKLAFADAVIWLTVQTDTLIPEKPGFVNAEIREAARRWPNLYLADMAELFEGQVEWRDDGTHPNGVGQLHMAMLIVQSLEPFRPQAV